MTRCYVCNAEPQDGCQAIGGEVAECPRPSLRRDEPEPTPSPRTILRARDLNRKEQE